MNLRSKFRMMAVVLAIFLSPAAFADQLTLTVAGVVLPSVGGKPAASLPSYSVSVDGSAIVLGIVNDFWTKSLIGVTGKVTGSSASQLTLAKANIDQMLRALNLAGLSTVLQKPIISLALSQRGWTVYKPSPGPKPVTSVPEMPGLALLGLNMAVLMVLAVVFRRWIIRSS